MATKISAELRKALDKVATNNGVCPTEREKVNTMLFDELVPMSGKCDTEAGEIIRAVNRIGYRFFNDGDIAGHGYGRETVNPAVRYLAFRLNDQNCNEVFHRFSLLLEGDYISDDEYRDLIAELESCAILYIALNKSYETHNTRDFWDFRDAELDVDNDPYEEDEWDEDYDEE